MRKRLICVGLSAATLLSVSACSSLNSFGSSKTAKDVSYPLDGRRDWVVVAANATPNTTLVARTPQKASPAVAPNVAPVPVAPSAASDYQNVEKRLTVIKDLKQKGLITEQEYDQKRKETLKNL